MARLRNKLSVRKLASLPPGKHSDGAGLWFVKRKDGGAQWVLRYEVAGRRREMGLGSLADVTLGQAREEADKWRSLKREQVDPISERKRRESVTLKKGVTLSDIALAAYESKKPSLKGDGKAGRWFSPLELHVLPKLGNVPITELNQIQIRDVLKPIWSTKAETARKALDRLGICLRHGGALGHQIDASLIDNVRELLGHPGHVPENIPALHWSEVPAFYQTLRDDTPVHLALKLLILTGLRSKPVRYLRQDFVERDVITIPGELMKGPRDATPDFRLPLTAEATEILEKGKRLSRSSLLFPGERQGPISDQSMAMVMKRAQLVARPHGFRSSLKTWMEETTRTPWIISEIMLGHIVGGKVERAYRRTDFLDYRRKLLQRWARFVTGSYQSKVLTKDEKDAYFSRS